MTCRDDFEKACLASATRRIPRWPLAARAWTVARCVCLRPHLHPGHHKTVSTLYSIYSSAPPAQGLLHLHSISRCYQTVVLPGRRDHLAIQPLFPPSSRSPLCFCRVFSSSLPRSTTGRSSLHAAIHWQTLRKIRLTGPALWLHPRLSLSSVIWLLFPPLSRLHTLHALLGHAGSSKVHVDNLTIGLSSREISRTNWEGNHPVVQVSRSAVSPESTRIGKFSSFALLIRGHRKFIYLYTIQTLDSDNILAIYRTYMPEKALKYFQSLFGKLLDRHN